MKRLSQEFQSQQLPMPQTSHNLSQSAGVFGKIVDKTYVPLKTDEASNHKTEILREADAMAALEHPHILRLIGICDSEPIMLVMELAKLGPLNKYLRSHSSSITIATISLFMYQICEGMAYLEEKKFVHRYLAARNILVASESSVKISEFGMSRAIGIDSTYYKSSNTDRLPLKWYAPECICFSRFDSKSDVWSYGVTLWEALSYGAKPYQNMQEQDILKMLEGGQRLPAPKNCPPDLYDVMLSCWQYRPEDRPSFSQLLPVMKRISDQHSR